MGGGRGSRPDPDRRRSRCSVEADPAHGAHRVVLAAPVGEAVVIALLQDVVRSSVVGLLVHDPPEVTGQDGGRSASGPGDRKQDIDRSVN